MATSGYIEGRRQYQRPQGMLWADNPGTISNGLYVPDGYEIDSNPTDIEDPSLANQFIILSDDNRSPLSIKPTRIERRERMINGRMRSYHIADKLTVSTSWDMLPSRAFNLNPNFNLTTGNPEMSSLNGQQYTTDGGAGGVDIVEWYENHYGSFWVYLSYDKRSSFGHDDASYAHLPQYSQVIEMFIADIDYSVVKRGGSNHDFWNISVTLEEV